MIHKLKTKLDKLTKKIIINQIRLSKTMMIIAIIIINRSSARNNSKIIFIVAMLTFVNQWINEFAKYLKSNVFFNVIKHYVLLKMIDFEAL